MNEKWERRERKKENARKMRVHGAGLRKIWQAIVERANRLSPPGKDKPRP